MSLSFLNETSCFEIGFLTYSVPACPQNGWGDICPGQGHTAGREYSIKGTKPIRGLSAARRMRGFPCGQNAVCFNFVWRWAARADSSQIKNNLHGILSANIPVTIIGLTFVSCSIRDLLSEPDKGPFLISLRNVDNGRTQSDVWLKWAVIWRYRMLPLMWGALCCILCTVNIPVTEQMLLPLFVTQLA